METRGKYYAGLLNAHPTCHDHKLIPQKKGMTCIIEQLPFIGQFYNEA
jgi:hypothetical protein